MMNIVEVNGLSYHYEGGRRVIDNLKLEVKRGEFVSIVGS